MIRQFILLTVLALSPQPAFTEGVAVLIIDMQLSFMTRNNHHGFGKNRKTIQSALAYQLRLIHLAK